MKNSKITRKITQGMYVLTTPGGGCVVDAVSRVGGNSESALVAVAIAKTNRSNELLHENAKFALSILSEQANPELIQNFGFKSARDFDKLSCVETEEIAGVEIIKDSIGYMVFDKVDAIENETHTLFIGRLFEADLFAPDAEPMTYAYYQAHKDSLTKTSCEGKTSADSAAPVASEDDLAKVITEQGKTAWVCTACGYIYYGDEVPDDYKCPLCGLGKAFFKRKA